jgi:hypothetical protein
MAVRDWTIAGDTATRIVGSELITIRTANSPTIEDAIRTWETQQSTRIAQSMRQLGDVVDAALTKAARRRRP